MQILFCSAEVAPFAKVGGLADVVGSLPNALTAVGIEPRVVLPRYGSIDPNTYNLEHTGVQLMVPVDGNQYPVTILKGVLPGGDKDKPVSVYFLDQPDIYGANNTVYPVGNTKLELTYFKLLTAAVPLLIKHWAQAGEFKPDVLHIHDWHTALLAGEVKNLRAQDPVFNSLKTVLTIHNLAYQGWEPDRNWLAEGIMHADAITTVSPNYAQEIQTEEFGENLQHLLVERQADLTGILNGIDTGLFDPATDKFIARQFTPATAKEGKAACKRALQKELGLPEYDNVPLMGFVGRLVDQKGVDLLLPAIEALADRPIQWALVGSGDPKLEEQFKALNTKYNNVRCYVGFNLALAQQVYAGSDAFLMPSRFEPCGLGQLISMAYGTAPVVRAVGGLKDTVLDADAQPDAGTGFCFDHFEQAAMIDAVERTVSAYQDQSRWEAIVQRCLAQDYSWVASARVYQSLYQSLVATVPV